MFKGEKDVILIVNIFCLFYFYMNVTFTIISDFSDTS
jgi:hypothetical protein